MNPIPERRVVPLLAEDADDVVSVLSDAFRDYPVMTFVLGEDRDPSRLRRLVTLFVMARVLRGEPMLGVRDGSGLVAATILSDPNDPSNPPELQDLRERTWEALGVGARRRYEAFGSATSTFGVDAPHLHLNMIGVRGTHAGRGLGRTLLDEVHGRSAADPSSTGVSLTTEVEANVGLYEHFGYEIVGRAPVGCAFTTWGMFRPDRVPGEPR